MADIRSKINELYALEQLAAGQTALHRLHPLGKLLVTFVYLICLLSLDSCALHRLAPFLFYPILCAALASVPLGMIVRRAVWALPFALLAGLGNVYFSRAPVLQIGSFTVSAGMLSLAVLLLRTLLSVSAVLILVSVTPFAQLTAQLHRLHLPEILIALTEMTYRYLGILTEEAVNLLTAFRLRSKGRQWPNLREFAPLAGQLLLRSADRAERVYNAMQCRCQSLGRRYVPSPAWRPADGIFLILGAGSAVLFREWDIMTAIGELFPW
ncbi:MAG: cobalt ECF transporter T component CbiQ [bacterium]|nr:cobalt ECF transporter T component CbiQ [bacterium]